MVEKVWEKQLKLNNNLVIFCIWTCSTDRSRHCFFSTVVVRSLRNFGLGKGREFDPRKKHFFPAVEKITPVCHSDL